MTTATTTSQLWQAWTQEDPDAHETSLEAVYDAATAYVAAGLSVIPIAADGSKKPDIRRLPYTVSSGGASRPGWKVYTEQRADDTTLYDWFRLGGSCGLAVIGGAISGGGNGCGLEIIDFDTAGLFEPWAQQVELVVPGLWQRLVRVQSPRPGVHVYYRCAECGGSQKLAWGAEANGQGKYGRKILIELKGEGGYCLVPPSPKTCHPSHRRYRLMECSGDLTAIPTIRPAERTVLLEKARSFNSWVDVVPQRPKRPVVVGKPADGLPGVDFDQRAVWEEILEPHGWRLVGSRGVVQDWCRPGKNDGISATTNYAGSGFLYVFSSNAHPFEDGQSYSKFRAYTLLNHGGSFEQAARELRKQGYGSGKGSGITLPDRIMTKSVYVL